MTFTGIAGECLAKNCVNYRSDNTCGSCADPENGTPDDYAHIDENGECSHYQEIPVEYRK